MAQYQTNVLAAQDKCLLYPAHTQGIRPQGLQPRTIEEEDSLPDVAFSVVGCQLQALEKSGRRVRGRLPVRPAHPARTKI